MGVGDGFAKHGGARFATDDTLADTGDLDDADSVEFAATQYPVEPDSDSDNDASGDGSLGAGSVSGYLRTNASRAGNARGKGKRAATERPKEFGRYVLEDRIGSGGMGVVYRAYDPMLDRHVALKIVRPVIGGTNAQRRLFREAQVLAKIRHPNIVAVYDVGTLGKDVFVAMDLVVGVPLQSWQKDRDWREILDAYLEAGKGLAAAHEQDLVHRDVKAGNVLIDERGHATVIDFGLAAVDSDEPPPEEQTIPPTDEWNEVSRTTFDQKLTHAGALMGTPRYMAPEQHDAALKVDARSDQFSFAVALFEAVTGYWPFADLDDNAGPKEIYAAKLAGVVNRPIPAGPRRLQDVLNRALSADPESRWASMEDFLRELRRAATAPERRRRRLVQLAVAASVAGVIAAVALPGREARAGRCEVPERYFEGVWDSETRAGLEGAFLRSNSAIAKNAWSRVEREVDAFATAWQTQQVETCRATFIEESQSPAAYDLRMMCLLDRLRPLRAMVQVYADPDEAMLSQAPRAAAKLPGLERCSDMKALQAAVPPPDDPAIAAAVDKEWEEVALAHALDFAGKYEASLQKANGLVERARSLDYGPLLAAALDLKGNGLARAGRYEEARQNLEEAFVVASHAGEAEIAASTTGTLIFLNAYDLSETDDALIWSRVLEGVVARTGAKTQAGAYADMGVLQWTVGDHERAIEYFERGLEVSREHDEARKEEYLLLNNLGLAEASLGRNDDAIATFRRALASVESQHGKHHPQRGDMLNNLAEMISERGDLDEAEALLKEAVEVWTTAYGDDHPKVAHGLSSQGNVLLKQDRKPEALAKFAGAYEIRKARLGPSHPSVSVPLVGLAEAEEDPAKAEQHLREALSICADEHCDERVHAKAALLLATTVKSRGESLRLAKRAETALAKLPETAAQELRAQLAELRAAAR